MLTCLWQNAIARVPTSFKPHGSSCMSLNPKLTPRRRYHKAHVLIPCAMLLVFYLPTGLAANAPEVIGLRPPAWLLDKTQRRPLTPGTVLSDGMRVETGAQGALNLRIDAATSVLLNENTKLAYHASANPPTMTLRLEQGEADFARTAVLPGTTLLDLQIDAWRLAPSAAHLLSRRTDNRSVILLINGTLSVTHPDLGTLTLSKPLHYMSARADSVPSPVLPANPTQAHQWINALQGVTQQDLLQVQGPWTVQLASLEDSAQAKQLVDRLHQDGFPAEQVCVLIKGQTFHRVRISGLASRADADRLVLRLGTSHGINDAWVTCPTPPCPH